jgi:hypothetical protein
MKTGIWILCLSMGWASWAVAGQVFVEDGKTGWPRFTFSGAIVPQGADPHSRLARAFGQCTSLPAIEVPGDKRIGKR